MKNSKKNNVDNLKEDVVKRMSKNSINKEKVKAAKINDEQNNDSISENDDFKERLRKRITEKQQLMDEAIEALEESYKEKSKPEIKIEKSDSTEERIEKKQQTTKKNAKKKKKFFRILLEKGKEIFVVKKKWELLVSALKKLFISIDDKALIINQLKLNNTQIKMLISKIKDEKLLKQLVNSLVFKKILDGSNIKIYQFVALQNSLINEINKVLKMEKMNLSSSVVAKTASGLNMESMYNKDHILKPELQTMQHKNAASDVFMQASFQRGINDTKLTSRFELNLEACTARFDQLMARTQNLTLQSGSNLYNLTSMSVDFLTTSIKNVVQGAISQIRDVFAFSNTKHGTKNFTSFPQSVIYSGPNNYFAVRKHNSEGAKHHSSIMHHSSVSYKEVYSLNQGSLSHELLKAHTDTYIGDGVRISQTQINSVSFSQADGNIINNPQR